MSSTSSSLSIPVESKTILSVPASTTIIPEYVAAWADAFSKNPHATRQQDSASTFGIQALSVDKAIQDSHDHIFSNMIPKEVRSK